MRVLTIEANNKEDALSQAPWASVVEEVEGGYIAFESWDDYYIHVSQV